MICLVRDVTLSVYLIYFSIPRLFGGADFDLAALNVEGSVLNQIIIIAALASALGTTAFLRVPKEKLLKAIGPIVAFALLAVVSVAWSNYPDLAWRRVFRLALELGTLSMLAAGYDDLGSLMQVIFRVFGIIALLDLAMIAVPSSFTPIGFKGLHGHKNEAGLFAFYSFAVFAVGIFDRRVARYGVLGLCGVLASALILALSHSKTGAGAALIGGSAVAMVLCMRSGIRPFVVLSIGMASVVLVAILLSGASLEQVVNFALGDPTLTGREFVWNYELARIEQAPLLGYGFGSFWGVGVQVHARLTNFGITFDYSQGHNGYLDIIAQLGVVGLGVAMLFLIGNLRTAIRLGRAPSVFGFYLCYLYLFSGLLSYNITELIIFRPGQSFWILWVLMSQCAAKLFVAGNRNAREFGALRRIERPRTDAVI